MSARKLILGIETSCDETAAAIVTDTREILSNVVLSQLKEHAAFGGVVPEIAARSHLAHLDNIIAAALENAGCTFQDLSAIAATCGPGLIGGLLVGSLSAKTLSSVLDIPFLAINHLEGHALTPRLTNNLSFPYLLLLISGGHTQILVVENVGQYKRWGTTLDDAAGECFDKSAKLMKLPFPGGPNVEISAKKCGNPIAAREKFPLPSPMKGRPGCDFSFSGLKTSVRNSVQNIRTENDTSDLASSFQDTVADVLADRCRNAMKRFLETYSTQTPTLVVAGGVSANQTIRAKLEEAAAENNMHLYAPPLSLCGDNAAMIAWAGMEHFLIGQKSTLDFKARPRWPLDPLAEKKTGAGIKA